MLLSSGQQNAIDTQLVAAGLPTEIRTSVLSAIDAAGFDLVLKSGGSPVSPVDVVTPTVQAVEGMRGLYWIEITDSGSNVRGYFESRDDQGRVTRFGG